MSDTLTVYRASVVLTLEPVRVLLADASDSAARESRWGPATEYLSLRGAVSALLERLAIWPQERLAPDPLWMLARRCERLADTAARLDWPELDALTGAEQYLQDLALSSQREEEGL